MTRSLIYYNVALVVYIYPQNDPEGLHGQALESLAARVSRAYEPLEELSDQAVLAGAEQGELVEPHPALAAMQSIEASFNWAGSVFRGAGDLLDAIAALTPAELAEVTPQLREHFPGWDFISYYEKNRLRDPGRLGKLFRPVLRVLGVEPRYWR